MGKPKRLLDPEDKDRVLKALGEVELTETQEKIRSKLKVGEDLRTGFLFQDAMMADLGPLYAIMDIVNRWKPSIDEQGSVLKSPEGNLEDPDDLDADATKLSSLNVYLSTIMGQLEAATETAESERDFLEATIRNKLREERRKGLKGDPTEAELKDLAKTSDAYREAQQVVASCKELSCVIKAVHFSSRRLEDRLTNRCRGLVSQWGQSVNRGTGKPRKERY